MPIIFCRHVSNVTSCYKISPIMFTFIIIFFLHVSKVTSSYKISLIIFAFIVIFCGHVSKISPIIFTFTIIFCQHVSKFTSHYKISPIIFTFTIIFSDMLVMLHHVTRSPPYWAVERLSAQQLWIPTETIFVYGIWLNKHLDIFND